MSEKLGWIAVDGTYTNLSDETFTTYYATGPLSPLGEYGVPVNIISHAVPLMPGVREQWVQVAANDVRFPLRVFGPTQAQLDANMRLLSEATRPTRGVGILQHTSNDGVIRQLFCRETARLRQIAAQGPGWLDAGMIFMAADPYWYDPQWTTFSAVPGGATNFFPTVSSPNPPATPVPTTLATGGTIAAGAYQVQVSYVTASGETGPSAVGQVTTTGSTSTITVPSPSAATGATGWYAYVSQAGGSSPTRQQAAGSPTAIGTNLVLTAPPSSTGAAPTSFFPLHISSGGISSGFTVPNNGQDIAWPVWQIQGPGTNPVLTNQTTNQVLTLTITLTSNQILTVDTRPLFINVSREDGSNQWAAVSDVSQLWPLVVGPNTISLGMSGTGSGSRLTLQYKQVYEGV